MKKRWSFPRGRMVLLAMGVVILLGIALPVSVSAAVSGGDALAGLSAFYTFMLGLAQQGLNGYIEFLKVLP